MANPVLKYDRSTIGGPFTLTNPGSTSSNQWFGSTLITSRHQNVSASIVAADSRILLSPEWYGVASLGVAVAFHVSSKAAGAGFFISTVSSVGFAANAASCQVHWIVTNPT